MSLLLQQKMLPLYLAAACILVSSHVHAGKSEWAPQSKQHSKHEQSPEHGNSRGDVERIHEDPRHSKQTYRYFDERHRVVAHNYFINAYRRGYCPAGLVPDKDGCIPRGQYKKWVVGRPLPQHVAYYDLPPQIVVNLGRPPQGHRYVRIASDILLITIGTHLVVDVIQGWNP